MMTFYFALEGAQGSSGYVPIKQLTLPVVEETSEEIQKAVHAYLHHVRLSDDVRLDDDAKTMQQARAWGYDEAWINREGYVVFVGRNPPREQPDPVLADWLPEKERQRLFREQLPCPEADEPKLVEACARLLVEDGLVSKEALELVLRVYGTTRDTLNDVLQTLTGETEIVSRYRDELKAERIIRERETEQHENAEENTEEKDKNEEDRDEEGYPAGAECPGDGDRGAQDATQEEV